MRSSPRARVDWSSYAAVYDLMAASNPAYAELKSAVQERVEALALPERAVVADLGAGTGEYSVALAAAHPSWRVLLIEPDPVMLGRAVDKLTTSGLTNVEPTCASAHEGLLEPGTLDLCVCVHALYAMPSPANVLAWIRSWLADEGWLVVCDLGRVLDVSDWRRYILRSLVRERGWTAAASVLWRGRQIARQNARIAREQRRGAYWTHSPEEFRDTVASAGFEVVAETIAYRGYSDIVVARRTERASS